MNHIRFDRHANMNGETLNEIMDILNEIRFDCGFELVNMVYGLFDGYLYNDLLSKARKELNDVLYNKVESVVNVINTYPKI